LWDASDFRFDLGVIAHAAGQYNAGMRFSIRDLLWLTLLAAFAVAWWIDRSRLAAEVERLRGPFDPFGPPQSLIEVDPFAGPAPSGDTDDP
jgi:hypothetical protein